MSCRRPKCASCSGSTQVLHAIASKARSSSNRRHASWPTCRKQVYVSFDVDELDPSSGSIWSKWQKWRRRPTATGGDADVGARVFYKMIGWTLVSQGWRRGAPTLGRGPAAR